MIWRHLEVREPNLGQYCIIKVGKSSMVFSAARYEGNGGFNRGQEKVSSGPIFWVPMPEDDLFRDCRFCYSSNIEFEPDPVLKTHKNLHLYRLACLDCLAKGPPGATKQEAYDLWNGCREGEE